MLLVQCDPACDESLGFPPALRPLAREVVARAADGQLRPPGHAFTVTVGGEPLQIPYRVYYNATLLRRLMISAEDDTRLLLACLGTRHCDGHVRQQCLAMLLREEAAWVIPYIVQLAGEYVLEITAAVAEGIRARNPATLAAFVRDNPSYMATLARRVTSYWNCYYRRVYPDRQSYPGSRVLAHLNAAAALHTPP